MAPKISKKKGGKSKAHSSAAKVANKKLNKFAKQGKLRKQRLKQKKKELKKGRNEPKEKPLTNGSGDSGFDENESRNPEDEAETELQEEDVEFYAGQEAAFTYFAASGMPSENKKNRKRRRGEDEEDESSRYEKNARTQFAGDNNQRMKMLLPIKDKGRVIPQMVEIEEMEEDEEEVEETSQSKGVEVNQEAAGEKAEEEMQPLPLLSGAELLVRRQQKLAERKRRIAELATAVIENPEENMSKMKELRKLLGEKDPDVCLTVRKLVMVSLCEIFRDIVPGYRLRLPTAQEKEQRMKQETKKLMDYESALLLSYKTYLEYLEHTIKGKSFENSLRLKRLGFCDVPLPHQKAMDLAVVAVQCMCKLLTTHPHFNYRSDVITFLVPLMTHRHPKLSDTVCQAVKDIFIADKSGEVILEIVKAMAKLLKSRKFHVQPKVLQTLLSLTIKEINTDKTESKKMKRKEKFQKLSRRDRKRLKLTEELEKELQETRATQDKEQRLRVHTQIVETMFTTFFNVLKREEKSPLLPVVLEALAKFTHLISVDFFHDLYAVFNKLIESGELKQTETLHCVQTAFRILSGQGSALTIDPMKFYTHLYKAVLTISAATSPNDAAIVLECVDASIIKRRKQVTQQRVLAFIKRLTTMGLHQLPQASAAYLATTRCMVSMFPYADILFDQEAEGSGVYMPYLQEPEHCHANSAVLWELHALRRHYHPDVKRLANALLHKNSSDHGELSKKTPSEVFRHIRNQDSFPASLPSKPSKKTKGMTSGFRSQEFGEELLKKYPQFFE